MGRRALLTPHTQNPMSPVVIKSAFTRSFAPLFVLIVLCSSLPRLSATETWWINGLNWADARDNYVDGWVLPSGITASTTPAQAASRAGTVGAGFRSIGCNMVRLPINPHSVLDDTWWAMYQALINRLVADGMHVLLAYWEGTAAKDGRIDHMANWRAMWQRVDGVYRNNYNVWFEPFNEPFGYSSSELIAIYRDFLSFIAKADDRIVLGGTGYSEDLSAIGGQFPNCKLSLHIYPWWGNFTTETAWQNELNRRVAGYWNRTILTEFGANATTGKNFNSPSSDSEIAFIRGITTSLRGQDIGSIYWPGVRDGDTFRLFNSSSNMTVTNGSLRDRIRYGWGF
jgi:endoglucanase